ncbi:hypothetical protein Tco_0823597 [Tanacetum coccineum]|uniref:Uncharacterized protein n=1 Tax=Tanacetum coccineum TaxID=301880 RepID=A0ABQ5AMG2_9ASTR
MLMIMMNKNDEKKMKRKEFSSKDVHALRGVSQLAEKATEELIENNLKACIAATIIEDRDAFRSEVPDLVSQEFNAQAPKIIEELFKNYMQSNVLKHKFEKSSTANTSYRDDDIHSHHDDHQEDNAPSEGEKRVKRHKASKSSKSAWEKIDIDEDEVIPKDETPELITELQDVDKRVPTIYEGYIERCVKSTRNLIQLDMVDSNGIQKELTAEPYEGDSEIAEAWFDQAAEYWKQAIALTPGNYIEALNWLKITRRFE